MQATTFLTASFTYLFAHNTLISYNLTSPRIFSFTCSFKSVRIYIVRLTRTLKSILRHDCEFSPGFTDLSLSTFVGRLYALIRSNGVSRKKKGKGKKKKFASQYTGRTAQSVPIIMDGLDCSFIYASVEHKCSNVHTYNTYICMYIREESPRLTGDTMEINGPRE